MQCDQQEQTGGEHHPVAPEEGTPHFRTRNWKFSLSDTRRLAMVRGGAQSTVTSRSNVSSSSTLPAPITTAVSGSSASVTGSPVSSRSRTSRLRSSAPPPASTIPLSTMSDASSGGVRSSAIRTDSTTWRTGSISTSRISSSKIWIILGTPATRSRPLISIVSISLPESFAHRLESFARAAGRQITFRRLARFLVVLLRVLLEVLHPTQEVVIGLQVVRAFRHKDPVPFP